jgi:hypothetical protein
MVKELIIPIFEQEGSLLNYFLGFWRNNFLEGLHDGVGLVETVGVSSLDM